MNPPGIGSKALYWRWLRATTLGWLLGLVLAILLALLWDAFGGESQFMVGVGIGAGVGYLQGRMLGAWLGRSYRWMVASTVGMGTLFVVNDVIDATGIDFPYSVPVFVLAGSLAVGIWQAYLLRPVSNRSNWWVVASVLGWSVPAAAVALGDTEGIGALKEIAGLGAIFFGGIMLGAVSGVFLPRILPPPPDQTAAEG